MPHERRESTCCAKRSQHGLVPSGMPSHGTNRGASTGRFRILRWGQAGLRKVDVAIQPQVLGARTLHLQKETGQEKPDRQKRINERLIELQPVRKVTSIGPMSSRHARFARLDPLMS